MSQRHHSANLIHLRDGHCLTEGTLKVCRLEWLDPRLQCDQLATALAMVAAGMGGAVVLELAVSSNPLAGLMFRHFDDPMLVRTISLMRRRSIPLSKAAEAMASLIKSLPENSDLEPNHLR